MSRLEIWQMGLDFVAQRPLAGGGFEGWIFATAPGGNPVDWHSAYVEMAAEHGLIGLGLWLALLLGALVGLTASARTASSKGDAALAQWAAMLRASLAGYMVGAAFLGVAYWALLYWLLAAAGIVARLSGGARESVAGATARLGRAG